MPSARLTASPRSHVVPLPRADMPTDSPHSLGPASSHSLRANGGEDAVIMGASTDESDNVALMEDVPKNKQVGQVAVDVQIAVLCSRIIIKCVGDGLWALIVSRIG